jgi:hypothetical protein
LPEWNEYFVLSRASTSFYESFPKDDSDSLLGAKFEKVRLIRLHLRIAEDDVATAYDRAQVLTEVLRVHHSD